MSADPSVLPVFVALGVTAGHRIVVRDDAGRPVVSIGGDGSVEFGPNVTPAAAAVEFFGVVRDQLVAHGLSSGVA